MSRRHRSLSREELALWEQVTAGVAPLAGRTRGTAAATSPAEEALPPSSTAEPARPVAASSPAKPPKLPPLAPIDRNERRRLTRGTRAIDGRIDLHGMRQAEAHSALRGFLLRAQSRGDSIVLVITGKGRLGVMPPFEDERGVLRRLVPHWLRMPDLRPLVVGFEEAHAGHGGGGALYVRLRRARRGGGASP
jgi:DNA-nicking Smr family endonuclease